MQYKDEEILKRKKEIAEEEKRRNSKNNLEQEAESSIYDKKVYIIGEEVSFERRVLPELKISIYMPESFFRFSDDVAKLLYPMGNTPSHIFGADNINFQMLFSQTAHSVPNEGMKSFVDMAAKLLEAMGPKTTIIEKTIEEKTLEEKTLEEEEVISIGILSFVSKAIETTVYNVQFYISIEGKLLMGGITFPSKYKKRLIPLAKEVINSIELWKEESED